MNYACNHSKIANTALTIEKKLHFGYIVNKMRQFIFDSNRVKSWPVSMTFVLP